MLITRKDLGWLIEHAVRREDVWLCKKTGQEVVLEPFLRTLDDPPKGEVPMQRVYRPSCTVCSPCADKRMPLPLGSRVDWKDLADFAHESVNKKERSDVRSVEFAPA